MSEANDLEVIRDALIVLGGFLPFFSGDPARVGRAEHVDQLKRDAQNALDRIADRLGEERPERRTLWR